MQEIRRAADPAYDEVYAVARRWRDTSLATGASLFMPDCLVWRTSVADELNRRFVVEAAVGARSFSDKLADQLRGVSQEARLLMAELMFVHVLPLNNMGPDAKVRNVNSIGAAAPEPFSVPAELAGGLEPGIFNGGTGYNTQRHIHLTLLIQFVRRWASIEPVDRVPLLADPWAFKELLAELPLAGASSQRNALLLLLFPETFEDISAREHKKRIVAAFQDLAGDSTDIDRQLLAIRAAKAGEFGPDFSWYAVKVQPTWDTPKAAPTVEATPTPRTVIEQLIAVFPNDDARRTFASAAAAVILAAHQVNPMGWSISARDRGVSLNAGPNRMLSVRPGRLDIAATGADPATILDNAPRAAASAVTIGAAYSFPANAYVVAAEPNDAEALLSPLRESMLDAVRASATRNTPYWRSHSREALAAIAELAGVDLPTPPAREPASAGDQHAFIVRVTKDGRSAVPSALAAGETRVFWAVDLPAGSSVEVIKQALRAIDPEASAGLLGNQAGNLHRFITRMQLGDVVLMPDRSDLYVGTVTGDAVYDAASGGWSRSVEWSNAESPLDRQEVSAALYSRLRSLLTVTDVTELLPELLAIIGAASPDGEPASVVVSKPSGALLPPIDDDLAGEWMLDRVWLEDIVELIRRKKQVIFYGPPGTGKTYLAEKLAGHLTSEGGNFTLVQFHPSYTYEDFVEGYRPRVDANGNLTYALLPGPLKTLADAARADPSEPYFLLIDEINRGNLAKVFGELYYLLEYRERSLVLQYGSDAEDEFSLPENLFVIGTMNTADRSIALVDAAIRRRFWFVDFSPVRPPIDGLLGRWLRKQPMSMEPARLLAELNRRLGDDDYAIGPSYLMNDDAASTAGLERIWRHGILPLLEEHFYGQPKATERFTLAALRGAVKDEPADDMAERADGVDGVDP